MIKYDLCLRKLLIHNMVLYFRILGCISENSDYCIHLIFMNLILMSHLISHLTDHLVNHLVSFKANRVYVKEVIYLFRYLGIYLVIGCAECTVLNIALYNSVSTMLPQFII